MEGNMTTVEPNRTDSLLPGEAPDSMDASDVQRWIGVYEDLLRTVPVLRPGDDGQGLPTAHIKRWQERLDFWNQRVRQ